MKAIQFIFLVLTISIYGIACSEKDDDDNVPDPGTSFFTFELDGNSLDMATTSTYDGSSLYISTQDRNNASTTLEIRSKTDGPGIRILNKNDGDPDDDQTLVLKYNGATYITSSIHFVELDITSLDQQNKEVKGSFQGEVVNKDDATEVILLENGSFSFKYF